MAKPTFTDDESDEGLARQRAKREHYASTAGERLHDTGSCQFSLLPYQELKRMAGLWYEAAGEALMRANYGPLEDLIREQVRIAAEQGFEPVDLIQLLQILRRVAIESEGWQEDMFADFDDVVNETLARMRDQTDWDIPPGLDYRTGKSAADRERELIAGAKTGTSDRRNFNRSKLRLPIRVSGLLPKGTVTEITRTENVARGGVYFLSKEPYYLGGQLHIMYPYWDSPGAYNPEYMAAVVRIDEDVGVKGVRGIALRFHGQAGKHRPFT